MSKSKIRKQKKRNIKKNRKKLMMRNNISKPSQKKKMRTSKYLHELWKISGDGLKGDGTKDVVEDVKKLHFCKEKLYTPHYSTLPKEIVEKIENLIKKYTIRESQCFYNSLLLAMNIKGMKIENGYYSYSIEEALKKLNWTEGVFHQSHD